MTIKKQSKIKRLDIFLLILFPVLATFISLFLKVNYFISTVLFFVVPAIYFSLRTPRAIKKVTAFTLLMYVPVGIVSDYIFEAGNAWTIPHSVFSFRVFGVIPIENFFWGIGSTYLCLMLYEHFIDKSKYKLNINKTIKIGLFVLLTFAVFVFQIIQNGKALLFDFPYFWIGLVVLTIPTISFLLKFHLLISKFIKICAYFFCLASLNEFTALSLGHWEFTSPKYIGQMPFFGFLIPFEEFFFYFIIMSLAIMSYFEFFFDDLK